MGSPNVSNMKSVLAAFCLLGVSLSLLRADDFRTWKLITGGHFEAKLNAAGTLSVSLENREGKVIDFPLADLKPSDREFVREWSAQHHDTSETEAVSVTRSAFARGCNALGSHLHPVACRRHLPVWP